MMRNEIGPQDEDFVVQENPDNFLALRALEHVDTGSVFTTPVEGVPNYPSLVIVQRMRALHSDSTLTAADNYLVMIQAGRMLRDFGNCSISAMEKALRGATVTATEIERRQVGVLANPPIPKNTARINLALLTEAGGYLLAHAKDEEARNSIRAIVGDFEVVAPLQRSALYSTDSLAQCFPPVALLTPDHRRRNLVTEGRAEAVSEFQPVIESVIRLFDNSVLDPRKFSQLAELRIKYQISPSFYCAKAERLRDTLTAAVAALIGFLDIVYGLPCPERLDVLFGDHGAHVLEYCALQLGIGQETAVEPSALCGPTTLCQDLFGISLLYQHLALEAIGRGQLSICDVHMRLAATFHRFSRGVARTVPVRVPQVLTPDRFRHPEALIARIEAYIAATAALQSPLTAVAQAVQVRDAVVLGVLGGIAGGHRVTQAIGTVLVNRAGARCVECRDARCAGNRIRADPAAGTVSLCLPHHKTQRAGVAARALEVNLAHESLAKLVSLYENEAREILHGDFAQESPLMFLSREGAERGRDGELRWHKCITGTRAGANQLVMQVSGRALGIKPGMSARDLRRVWLSLVNSLGSLQQESRGALIRLVGTSERQVQRTYDVTLTARALEQLAVEMRNVVAAQQGRPGDLGDAAEKAAVIELAPPKGPVPEEEAPRDEIGGGRGLKRPSGATQGAKDVAPLTTPSKKASTLAAILGRRPVRTAEEEGDLDM